MVSKTLPKELSISKKQPKKTKIPKHRLLNQIHKYQYGVIYDRTWSLLYRLVKTRFGGFFHFLFFLNFFQTHFNNMVTEKLIVAPIAANTIVFMIASVSNIVTTLSVVPETVPIIVVLSFVYSITY